MIGGPAVYEARAILNVDVYDTCLTGGSRIQNLWVTSNSNQHYSNKFNVHPNPANNYLTVIKSNSKIQDAVFVLREIAGRELKRIQMNEYSNSISLTELSQGFYLYEIYVDKKLFQTDKLIINH